MAVDITASAPVENGTTRQWPSAGARTKEKTLSTANTNRQLVRQYLEAFNNNDHERISELLADDVVEHGIHEELHGTDEIVEFLQRHFEIFPDYTGETDAMVAEGDTVVVRYTVSGTHKGEYLDVEPTGQTAEWTGMAMYRIEDGQIAEIWLEEDRLGLLEQLDIAEPPAHLRI